MWCTNMDNAIALGLVSFFVLASSNVEAFVVPPRPSSSIQDTLKPSDPNLQHVHLSASMTIHRIFSRRGRTSFPGSVKELRATAAKSTIASPAALELQAELKRLSAGTSNGVKANPSERERIEQLARELNALNPTKKPALSPLLEGRWRVLYTTVPGPSSGHLGPFVGDVFQEIRIEDKRIINILELGPSWALRGALEADVEILDSQNWAITLDVVYNNLAGIRVQEKKFDPTVTERRIWTMTYLDKDFRVVHGRRESSPLTEGFIFIIERDTESSSSLSL